MVLTASAMATCTMAMQRDHGLPATFPAFRTSMDVWFHSLTVSAPAGPAASTLASAASTGDSHRLPLALADVIRRSRRDATPSRDNAHGVPACTTATHTNAPN